MRLRIAREGVGLILGFMVVLTVAMSYANNLAYIFAFVLAGFCLISLVIGYASLKALEITRVEVESGPIGSRLKARVHVHNRNRRDFCVAQLTWTEKPREVSEIAMIDAGRAEALAIDFAVEKRGKYEMPKVRVTTNFPAGIFSWSRAVEQKEFFFVYPRTRGNRKIPEPKIGREGEGESGIGRGDDFHGHRLFQTGEPERHIDWKLFARSEQKLVKDFRGGSQQHFWFSLSDLPKVPFEEALEQVAVWALAVESKGGFWGFEVGDVRLELGRGTLHFQRTLELLSVASELTERRAA